MWETGWGYSGVQEMHSAYALRHFVFTPSHVLCMNSGIGNGKKT